MPQPISTKRSIATFLILFSMLAAALLDSGVVFAQDTVAPETEPTATLEPSPTPRSHPTEPAAQDEGVIPESIPTETLKL
jgi:hypothetical protein